MQNAKEDILEQIMEKTDKASLYVYYLRMRTQPSKGEKTEKQKCQHLSKANIGPVSDLEAKKWSWYPKVVRRAIGWL